MGLVKKFEEIRKDDILDVGGKGANLGEMVSADIAVPPGFVVTSDAYRRFLKENGLNELFLRTMNEAQDDPEKLRAAAALFREKILSSTLPSEIVSEVTAAYNSLSVKCGIPHSSCSSIFGNSRGFTGVRFCRAAETYLNVIGLSDVLEQIVRCYASLR